MQFFRCCFSALTCTSLNCYVDTRRRFSGGVTLSNGYLKVLENSEFDGSDCMGSLIRPLLCQPLRLIANTVTVGASQGFLEAGPSVEVPKGSWTLADVRDVSAAHIAAAETPEAGGRYIVSHQTSISAR